MQRFDGKLRIVTGFPRQGKTAFVISQLREPFLFVCTGESNPSVEDLPFVPDTMDGLKYVLAHPQKTMAIQCTNANPLLFEAMKKSGRQYILDEVGNVCCTYDLKENFKKWAREVGWIDGGLDAWATTQRPSRDIPPGVYDAAREVYWVGPCKSKSKQNLLIDISTLDMDEEEFRDRLRSLKKVEFPKPNFDECVFKIKDI